MPISFQYMIGFSEVLRFIILITSTIFLIVAGVRQRRWRHRIFILLIVGGLLYGIVSLIGFLTPAISLTPPQTPEDTSFFQTYILINFSLLPNLTKSVVFGLFFIIIGLKTREDFGIYLTIAGGIACGIFGIRILTAYSPISQIFSLFFIVVLALTLVYSTKIQSKFLSIGASLLILENVILFILPVTL